MSKVSGGIWERTRKCGCGECRYTPFSAGPCALEKSKDAVWLWATNYDSSEESEEGIPAEDMIEVEAGVE